MGCFLGCFGDAKDHKRRKQRINRAKSQVQENRVEDAEKQTLVVAEQKITETLPTILVSELKNNLEEVKQLSSSPPKRVTFNSNIIEHEHVSILESIDCDKNVEKEKDETITKDVDDDSITSSVGSYPPNHRYHNSRNSDDESTIYGDSELDDIDDYDEEFDDTISGQEVWSESILISSMESRTENNPSPKSIDEEVQSAMVNTPPPDNSLKAPFGPKIRDRSDYVNSVLNPVENINQWKALKSKGSRPFIKPWKENSTINQEISVDASLSNWLVSPEMTTPPSKKSTPVKSFEDRPILGALTLEEIKEISKSLTPRKSPSRSPEDMPIIGTVGTYWNHSGSGENSDSVRSFKGIPNTTSKYREDKRVNWHSTPFETRLDRALNRGVSEV